MVVFEDGHKYVVKARGLNTSNNVFQNEIALLNFLYEKGLRVPKIIARSQNRFMMMEFIEGISLENCKKKRIWKTVGKLVTTFRNISLDEVKPYIRRPWSDFETLESKFEKHKLLKPPFTQILKEAKKIWSTGELTFIHSDFGPGQVLVNENGVDIAIIDWENASEGSILAPLARCIAMVREYLKNEQFIEGLKEGFEEIIPLTNEMKFELHIREMISHMRDMSWKLEWYPEHHNHAMEIAEKIEKWTEM
jgi:RIO-like serine/threonine protein kinase